MNWKITSLPVLIKNIWDFLSILKLEMSSSHQNYLFEVPIKSNNSQTFVQTKKNLEAFVSAGVFSNAFSVEAFRLFQGKAKFFFQVLQYFSRVLPQKPIFPGFPGLALFFQVFQVRWEPWLFLVTYLSHQEILNWFMVTTEMKVNFFLVLDKKVYHYPEGGKN